MNLHDAIKESELDTAELKVIGFNLRVIWNEGKYRVEYWNKQTGIIAGYSTELTMIQLKEEIGSNYYAQRWKPYI